MKSCLEPIIFGIDIGKDVLDAGLEVFINDKDLLNSIPGISAIAKMFNGVSNISNAISLKKFLKFMSKIEEIDLDERKKYYEKHIKNDDDFKDKIWMYIERVDDMEKATIIGTIFKKLVMGQIDKDLFFRLCNIIDKLYIGDLTFLKNSTKYFIISDCNGYPIKKDFNEYIANIGDPGFNLDTGYTISEYKNIEASSLSSVGITIKSILGNEYSYTQFGMEVFKILFK